MTISHSQEARIAAFLAEDQTRLAHLASIAVRAIAAVDFNAALDAAEEARDAILKKDGIIDLPAAEKANLGYNSAVAYANDVYRAAVLSA